MKAGVWDLTISQIKGYNLLTPQSYLNASDEEVDEKTGGCGPGNIGDWFVPDTMYGESVFLACRIHDWMYGEGEDELDRRIADRTFLWNMTVLIQDVPFTGVDEDQFLDLLRLRRVMTYYQAVSEGGSLAFGENRTVKLNDLAEDIVNQIIEG